MDYVTRQFIILAKKLRKELPKLAHLIHRDLQQHTEAIHAAQKSNEQQRDVQPVWLDPILTKYQQSVTDKETSDNRNYGVQNSLRWAAWFAFIAAAFYGLIAVCQWRAFLDANKINREGVESVQRAFVFFQKMQGIPTADSSGNVTGVILYPILANTGKNASSSCS